MGNFKRFANVLPLVLAVAAIFALVWQLSRPIEPARADSRCPERLRDLRDTVKIGGVQSNDPVVLTTVDGEGKSVPGNALLKFRVGRGRDVLIRRQTFRLPAGAGANELEASLMNDFADLQRDLVLPTDRRQVMFRFLPKSAPGTVTLVACIDPAGPEAVYPGSYVGAAAITTARGSAATFSLDVKAQDHRWWLVLAFAVGGGLVGILVKLLADRRTLGDNADVPFHPRTWDARTWIAFGAGLTTAIYSYLTIYADDPTFMAELGTLWRVAAETFAGTLAAKTLTDLVPKRGE